MFLHYSHTHDVLSYVDDFINLRSILGGWLTRLQVHLISITAWRFCFTLNLFILFIFTSGGFPLVFSLPFTLPLCFVPYFFVSVCVYVIVRLCVFLTTGNEKVLRIARNLQKSAIFFSHRTDIFMRKFARCRVNCQTYTLARKGSGLGLKETADEAIAGPANFGPFKHIKRLMLKGKRTSKRFPSSPSRTFCL